jgi:predicted enzyme related to lactoylglutathione lyase
MDEFATFKTRKASRRSLAYGDARLFQVCLTWTSPPFRQSARNVMHHSRLCALLIDCNTADIDQAASFWAEALGRPVDPDHPGTRGSYRMLETPQDEPIVQIQRVDHESRVHIDIETDDIPAEVARLEKLGATVVNRLERWTVMQAPTGQRFCVVRIQRPGFPGNAARWD